MTHLARLFSLFGMLAGLFWCIDNVAGATELRRLMDMTAFFGWSILAELIDKGDDHE